MRISPRSDSPRGRSSYVLCFTVSLRCFKQLHFNSVERYLLVNSWPLTSQTCRTSQRRASVAPTPVNVPPTSADDQWRSCRRCHFLLDWSDSKWDVDCCCWGSWRTIWSMEKHVTCLHHHIRWSAGLKRCSGCGLVILNRTEILMAGWVSCASSPHYITQNAFLISNAVITSCWVQVSCCTGDGGGVGALIKHLNGVDMRLWRI